MLCFILSFQIGQINVKVLSKHPQTIQETYKGPTEMQNLEVADVTGKTTLTIWGEQIQEIKQGSSYTITNLTYWLFPSSHVSTTPSSQISTQTPIVIPQDILSIELPRTSNISTTTNTGIPRIELR